MGLLKSEAKRELRRALVREGVQGIDGLRGIFPSFVDFAFAERELERWITGMQQGPRFTAAPKNPRLVNHFKLGADPEMVLGRYQRGPAPMSEEILVGRVNAEDLGMHVGLAYGADNNGRLVELRLAPTRFALEMLAGTLDTLRWMGQLCPATLDYWWVAGAYIQTDGLGGHIHFGRKQSTTPTEARALDWVMGHLLMLGVYPAEECRLRAKGDARGQRYGRPYVEDPAGAVRLQAHGYEYRSLPSWLDSPEQAYLSMVLAKLVVHDPQIIGSECKSVGQARTRVMNLLMYYQGRDDDAAIALAMIRRSGFPGHKGGDFRPRWGLPTKGIGAVEKLAAKAVMIKRPAYSVPRVIPPRPESVEQVFQRLVNGKPLAGVATIEPTWPGAIIPADAMLIGELVVTAKQQGLGEIIAELVVSKKLPVRVVAGGNGVIRVSARLARNLPGGWEELCKVAWPESHVLVREEIDDYLVTVGAEARHDKAGAVRKVLLCGAFPIWHARDYKPGMFEAWQGKAKQKPKREAPQKMLTKRIAMEDM